MRMHHAAAVAAVLLAAPAMASPQSHRAHALYLACRAYGEGRMPLDRFVDAVWNLDRMTYPRLKFWLLLCGGA